MREFGKIITRKTDLTDAQVQEKYKFPAIIILHDNEDQILKITHYQKNGTKTIYDFSLSASKQFVTDSISTAIAGLQDNRLEFNEFSDFPAIGDETKFYIDLTDDRIYIWDSYSQSYKNQSWDTATIASIQASIASAQMAFQNLENSKQKKVTAIPVTGNITLSEIHNGAMLHITNSCIITFPSNLGKDFNFVEKAFGSIVVQHVAASGVSLNSDSGLILKNGATGSVYAPSNDNFILTGTYSTT